MDTGRTSEGAGGSPGFWSSLSDKDDFQSGFAENHIAHRAPSSHPARDLGNRIFQLIFQILTRELRAL
jgi:hypothetical protein